MDSIQFTNFSTDGVVISDTFETWRQKTNGIITEVSDLRADVSPLFFNNGNSRTVTLDTAQEISGIKTFSAGSSSSPTLKVGNSGLYETAATLVSTSPLQSSKLIATSELQLGSSSYIVPANDPIERSLLDKTGNTLTWTTYSSIISDIRAQGSATVTTTNIVLPVGSIIAYSAVNAPTGWLRCNGTRFRGGDYPELATLLLNTYGPVYTTATGSIVASNVYDASYYYTLPSISGSIMKAIPDRVINTFIDRGNVFDIIKGGSSVQSLSLTDGGTGTLNLKINNTLSINAARELGVADLPIDGAKIINGTLTPNKLSIGAPVWDSTSALYEGTASPDNRVATRKYVNDIAFKAGPVARLIDKPSSARHTSAPVSGNFGYINHDGVPVVSGASHDGRLGHVNKYSNTEMPLPDNRRAVSLHISYRQTAALDDTGQLWTLGLNHFNMFNTAAAAANHYEWTLAYAPLYSFSSGNRIKKVIMSGSLDINTLGVIDTSNRLWISGANQYGVLGRNDTLNTNLRVGKIESTWVLENVLDAMILGSFDGKNYPETCIALTPSGLRIAGYGSNGLGGDGLATAINAVYKLITVPGVTDYSACELYGFGEDSNTTAFLLDKSTNIIYGWGYGGANGTFGDNNIANKNIPTIIWNNPDVIINKIYSTHHSLNAKSGFDTAAYLLGNQKSSIVAVGSSLTGVAASSTLGTAVAINGAGTVFTVGAPGVGNGLVNIHTVSGNTISLSTTLNGTAAASRFGEAVAINLAGNVLAVGAPNTTTNTGRVIVYANSGGTWSQRGAIIEKLSETNAKAGSSVAISSDGNVVVIGSPNFGASSNRGKVTTWRWNGTAWVEFGNAIESSIASTFFGKRVACNSAGTTIAFSSDLNGGTVHAYELINDAWVQLGTPIIGLSATDANGTGIALNSVGDILAIGAPGNDSGGTNFGQTRVFKLNTSKQWIAYGSPINGKSADDASGTRVALSADGNTLVIGSPDASSVGLVTNGRVSVYQYINSVWKLVAGDINGTSASEKSGSALAITSDASKILIGAPNFTSSTLTNRGATRLFEFANTTSISSNVWCSGSNTGNKFGLIGSSNTWRTIGELPSGYSIVDFYCGNGYEANTVNFVKAYRASDQKFYLFVAGTNETYSAGGGYSGPINSWTRLNLASTVIEKIIDVQTVASYGYGDYSVLHLNDGTLYFAGRNAFMIDPNVLDNTDRTDFTLIK